MGRTSNADQKLMDATIDLIWEESYGSVTIDDICKRAGVKTGSFYYFFKSKSDLAVAALERLWKEDWKPSLDQTFSSSVDPLARLTNYFDGVYARSLEIKKKYGRMLGCPVSSVGSEVSTHEAGISEVIRDMMARKRRYYESAIRDAVAEGAIEPCDPAEVSLALFALLEGLVTQARITNDPEILRKLPAMGLSLLRVKTKGGVPVTTATAQG